MGSTDPTAPIPPSEEGSPDGSRGEFSWDKAASAQLKLVESIQRKLNDPNVVLTPREYKDLAGVASSTLGMLHRTEEAQRQIASYKLVFGVIIEFLKSRSDPSLGLDLLAELKEASKALKAEIEAERVISDSL